MEHRDQQLVLPPVDVPFAAQDPLTEEAPGERPYPTPLLEEVVVVD